MIIVHSIILTNFVTRSFPIQKSRLRHDVLQSIRLTRMPVKMSTHSIRHHHSWPTFMLKTLASWYMMHLSRYTPTRKHHVHFLYACTTFLMSICVIHLKRYPHVPTMTLITTVASCPCSNHAATFRFFIPRKQHTSNYHGGCTTMLQP
jgi:hypothetical protein